MVWRAIRKNTSACVPAVSNFSYPQNSLTRDFSNTFSGQTEAVYYATSGPAVGDPYTEGMQPYLGKTTINYTFAGGYTPIATKKVFIIISTEPLISGATINMANMDTRSRYVILAANDQNFVFNYMHPGSYYVYALYDADNNNTFSTGDWFSFSNTAFTVGALGNVTANTQIDFTIP